mmetsp:Transcript_86018/g.244014  ORF Transcript_86018/g.244014 Transcript_86018/m.244014 type:complete len:212 (-) Transcript_86018:8-643(-)
MARRRGRRPHQLHARAGGRQRHCRRALRQGQPLGQAAHYAAKRRERGWLLGATVPRRARRRRPAPCRLRGEAAGGVPLLRGEQHQLHQGLPLWPRALLHVVRVLGPGRPGEVRLAHRGQRGGRGWPRGRAALSGLPRGRRRAAAAAARLPPDRAAGAGPAGTRGLRAPGEGHLRLGRRGARLGPRARHLRAPRRQLLARPPAARRAGAVTR